MKRFSCYAISLLTACLVLALDLKHVAYLAFVIQDKVRLALPHAGLTILFSVVNLVIPTILYIGSAVVFYKEAGVEVSFGKNRHGFFLLSGSVLILGLLLISSISAIHGYGPQAYFTVYEYVTVLYSIGTLRFLLSGGVGEKSVTEKLLLSFIIFALVVEFVFGSTIFTCFNLLNVYNFGCPI